MARTQVLVAEDTTLLRKLLIQQLARETDIEVIGEAAHGREAVDLALRLRPQVVVMDLLMPFLNGVQATERITARYPEIRVVLLTAHEDLASLGRLGGAYECLVKGCTPQELVAAIRRAQAAAPRARGGAGPASGYEAAVEHLAMRAGLTRREKAVAERVVLTELTLQQIGQALSAEWGEPVTESAVKHALERVMTKMVIEPRTRAALIKHVVAFQQPY
ncbi:MAG TPA: response regulator [Armatimonadota bacterium]|nr:response regulator [Armatimonadota bacterium]